MTDLDGKGAVITGGASGIGLGMVRACLERGMRVAIADLDAARAGEVASTLRTEGAHVSAHECDVRDPAQVETLRDAALTELGGIDLVCNNAGMSLIRPITQCEPADWQLVFDVNLTGVINGIQAFVPHLVEQRGGHISATASLSGLVADPDLVIYDGTKFAVVGLMEGLALELRRDHPGVTASVLCPGPVATDLIATSSKALADVGEDDLAIQEIATQLARGMSPDDAGKIAVDGIADGHFWLLTHPDLTFSLMEPRFAAMKERALFATRDWT